MVLQVFMDTIQQTIYLYLNQKDGPRAPNAKFTISHFLDLGTRSESRKSLMEFLDSQDRMDQPITTLMITAHYWWNNSRFSDKFLKKLSPSIWTQKKPKATQTLALTTSTASKTLTRTTSPGSKCLVQSSSGNLTRSKPFRSAPSLFTEDALPLTLTLPKSSPPSTTQAPPSSTLQRASATSS